MQAVYILVVAAVLLTLIPDVNGQLNNILGFLGGLFVGDAIGQSLFGNNRLLDRGDFFGRRQDDLIFI